MGDSDTEVLGTVYACDPARLTQILDILHDCGMLPGDDIQLGKRFMSYDASPYTVRELAGRLEAADPSIVFEVYDRPSDEYLGTVIRHAPMLGRWEAECDHEGMPVARYHDLVACISGDGNRINPGGVDNLYGLPWADAISYIRKLTSK